jgi:hypothetical protein
MINDNDPFLRPTQREGALAQRILPLRAFRVFRTWRNVDWRR